MELSRKLGLRQKTCWYFKRKVMKAMESSDNHPLTGNVDVDESFVGGQETSKQGRGKERKKLVVFAIEKRGKGVSRLYGKVIEQANAKNLGNFMRTKISPDAEIKTDKWQGYKPLQSEFKNLTQISSGEKGENFPEIHHSIMLFKAWLRGIHLRVNDLQAYIDEYTYRFNRHFMNAHIFDNLILRMIRAKPYYLYD
jgi:transposase-like protein